jgi:hypothetical protein
VSRIWIIVLMHLFPGRRPVHGSSLKKDLRFGPRTVLTIRQTSLARASRWRFLRSVHYSFKVVIRVVARLFDDLLGAHLQFRLISEFPYDNSMSMKHSHAWSQRNSVDGICIGCLISPHGYDQSPAQFCSFVNHESSSHRTTMEFASWINYCE